MWEYNYYNPSELYHYGVPGMKWGRRKARQTASTLSRSKQQTSSEPAEGKKKMSTKKKAAIGAAAVATALAAYGAYKYTSIKKQNLALGKNQADTVLKQYKLIGDEFHGLGKRAAMIEQTKRQSFSTAYKNVKEANKNLNRNAAYYGPGITRYKGKIHYNGTAGF